MVSGTVTADAGTDLNTSTLALESGGNLATLATAQGASGSGITQPTGGSGILGWLSGIYKAITGTLTVAGTVGVSGTVPVSGTFWQTTQPVSLTSLPSLSAGTNAIGSVFAAPTSSSSFAITPGSSSTTEGSHVLKSSAGNLYALYVVTGATAGYLMTFNATTVPANGAVTPVECIPVPANSIGSIDFGVLPDTYSTGIVAVFSSTGPFTKTLSATAFFKWRVE